MGEKCDGFARRGQAKVNANIAPGCVRREANQIGNELVLRRAAGENLAKTVELPFVQERGQLVRELNLLLPSTRGQAARAPIMAAKSCLSPMHLELHFKQP